MLIFSVRKRTIFETGSKSVAKENRLITFHFKLVMTESRSFEGIVLDCFWHKVWYRTRLSVGQSNLRVDRVTAIIFDTMSLWFRETAAPQHPEYLSLDMFEKSNLMKRIGLFHCLGSLSSTTASERERESARKWVQWLRGRVQRSGAAWEGVGTFAGSLNARKNAAKAPLRVLSLAQGWERTSKPKNL